MSENATRILSIDDSKAVHAFLDRCIAGTTYKIIHALGGREGIEILKKEGNSLAVILLDWEMPELTGPETLVEIKKLGLEIPVIMVTSKNDVTEIQAMLSGGATEYVMKPFTPDILIEKIESVITQKST